MTEAEWLACADPVTMLRFISENPDGRNLWIGRARPSARKWRLLGVASCRRVWSLITEVDCRRVVEAVEAFADGEVSEVELRDAMGEWEVAADEAEWRARIAGYRIHDQAYCAIATLGSSVGSQGSYQTPESECSIVVGHSATARGKEQADQEMRVQSGLSRCIFGNPFRFVTFEPEWRTSTVVSLARRLYETRDFDPIPLLADALQDAGCENEDILNHCRSAGPHVRGCWVVDLILGKN